MKWISLLFIASSCLGQGFGTFYDQPFLANPATANGSITNYVIDTNNLILWIDIYSSSIIDTNGVAPTNNSRVKFVQDLTFYSNNVQNISSNSSSPVYSTSGGPLTNGPCLIFTHSNFTYFTNSSLVSQQTNIFYFAFRNRQDTTIQSGFIDPTTADRIGEFEYRDPGHSPGVAYGMYDGSINSFIGNFNDIPNSVWSILCVVMNGTISQIRTNGVFSNLPGNNPGTNAIHGITLGNYFNFSQGADMDLVGFLWYTGVQQTTNQMNNAEHYLGNRFNIPVH